MQQRSLSPDRNPEHFASREAQAVMDEKVPGQDEEHGAGGSKHRENQ